MGAEHTLATLADIASRARIAVVAGGAIGDVLQRADVEFLVAEGFGAGGGDDFARAIPEVTVHTLACKTILVDVAEGIGAQGPIGNGLHRADALAADRLLTRIGRLRAVGVGAALGAHPESAPGVDRAHTGAALVRLRAAAPEIPAVDGAAVDRECTTAESGDGTGDEATAAAPRGKRFGQDIETMTVHWRAFLIVSTDISAMPRKCRFMSLPFVTIGTRGPIWSSRRSRCGCLHHRRRRRLCHE